MIIESKNQKQVEARKKEISLYDFTTLTEGNWEAIFSKMKKYLPFENIKKPFFVEYAVEDGELVANMWFVAEESKVGEYCLKFDLFNCYRQVDKAFVKDEDLTQIWQKFMSFRFKYYAEKLQMRNFNNNV